MPKARSGDAEIYYEEHGAGQPLVLVPGLGGVASYWNANVPVFSQKYRVITHDHRGMGQSSRSKIRYSVDQMADDLLRLMDHLDVGQVHLIGHSTGGAIGQTLALTHPERLKTLVIYASWTKADPFFRRVFEARRSLLLAAGAAAYVRATGIFLYPDWWVNDNIALLEEREKLAIAAFPGPEIVASRIDAVVDFDRTAGLSRIRTPTLVICAKDDFLTPPYFSRELARLIPGAELLLLERGGHCASETSSGEFNRAVLSFLDRHA